MKPVDFQGQGSGVKVTRYTLLLHLVNTIQTDPFQLGIHTTYDKRTTPITFKVKGQGHMQYIVVNLVNMIQIEPFQLGSSNLEHILLMTKG